MALAQATQTDRLNAPSLPLSPLTPCPHKKPQICTCTDAARSIRPATHQPKP
jgi:hypothetical protein